MRLTEIYNDVLLESGQFFLDDLDDFQLDMVKFWRMVKHQLELYQVYRPFTKTFTIEPQDKFYTFSYPDIPKWVSKVVQILPYGVLSRFALFKENIELFSSDPMVGKYAPWVYRKPVLYLLTAGRYEVRAHYDYEYIEERPDSVDLTDVDILDITGEDIVFKDLVLGEFLKQVGVSRESFSFKDLPIKVEGTLLITRGDEVYKGAVESLKKAHSKWYDVINP